MRGIKPAVAAVLGVLVLSGVRAIAATPDRIHLPTRADAIAAELGAEQILNGRTGPLPSKSGLGGLETRLPGPATDRERITVDVGPTGEPVAVRAVQRLHLTGLGDFSFKVPGPATDVEGLPGSDEQPGLRKGAVLWQGFSPGKRVLGAVLDLHPDLESQRLPLRFRIRALVGGTPVQLGERVTGPLTLTVMIENRSAVPVSVPDASADPSAAGAALDAVHEALAHRERPAPGSTGIPTALSSTGSFGWRTLQAEAPFRIHGTLRFPPGSVDHLVVRGAKVRGDDVRLEGELGGGAPLTMTIRITGVARDLPLPEFVVRADPAPPLATSVAPPTGGSWAAYATAHPDASRHMVAVLLDTLWRTARLAPFDAYLGNPDPTGPATSVYRFRLVPEPDVRGHPVAALSSGVKPLGVLLLAVVLLLLLAGLAVAWARA